MNSFVTKFYRGDKDIISNKRKLLLLKNLISVEKGKHQADNFNVGQVWRG